MLTCASAFKISLERNSFWIHPFSAPLMGSSREAEPILRSIHATVSAGGRVVVTDHTIEEFLELVGSDRCPTHSCSHPGPS